jgi:GR25 family glycosyltransferase involved in LPS biosynthesis
MQIHELDFPQTAPLERRGEAVDRAYDRSVTSLKPARSLKIRAFIVHLDRAVERQPQVDKLMTTLPVPTEIIEAVDGNELSKAEIDLFYRRHLHQPRYPFQMSVGEIACFLSHRKAWAEIVKQDLDAGFVIEDDVDLEPSFATAFAAASACLAPGAFIRFPFRTGKEHGDSLLISGETSVIQPRRVGLGMVAQLISRDAAIRLLQATAHFDRPVDTLVQMGWVTQLSPLAVLPGGVSEISSQLGGSTIKGRKTLTEKLAKEVLRPLYRARIAMRSTRFI